jgi:predicted membrane protein
MKLNGNNLLVLVLISLGVLLLLGAVGISLGYLMKFILPLGLLVLGYIGLKNGRGFIGTVLIVLGLLFLLKHLSGLVMFLLAVGLIWYGLNQLGKRKSAY